MLTKKRVTISIKLFKNDKVVQSGNFRIKARVLPFVQGLITANAPRHAERLWDYGSVRVVYNKDEDYYNEATFENQEQLKLLLTEFTDPYLINRFS